MKEINLTWYLRNQSGIIWALVLAGFTLSLWLAISSADKTVFPSVISDPFNFSGWINDGESWMKKNYRWVTRLVAGVIKEWYYSVEDFLIEAPWIFIFALMIIPSLKVAGLRLTLFVVFTLLFWGFVGMWEQAMQTVALMTLSVIFSVVLGVLVGIWCSQSDRVEAFVRPILDTMQVMPAFVYLLPAIFFFGIGGPPAILASMIYAMPPIIRLTNLGIRQVPKETIETAESFGSNRFQMLTKIQMPLALPSIMMGVNQTIMMALGLVVLAAFIGAQGLGYEVWLAIRRIDVGWAMEAGLCILFMAIMFDRFSASVSKEKEKATFNNQLVFRLFPQSWHKNSAAYLVETLIEKVYRLVGWSSSAIINLLSNLVSWIIGIFDKERALRIKSFFNDNVFALSFILILGLIFLIDIYLFKIGTFPETWRLSVREPVQAAVDWLAVNPSFVAFTKGMRAFIYLYMLNPLDYYLLHLPWWFTMISFMIISFVTVGIRFAFVAFALLCFIGACGIWGESMITLSSVLVSVAVCFIFGVPLGVLAAYNKRFRNFQEPILDAMQTLPSFCYLIPVLMLFGGNKVSAIIATVIYSIVPIIRLTILGLTQVSESYTEVSKSFGGTTLQTLIKIKYPMAVPSLVMGFNQTVMMAFAMQIVTPLIGGKGLGREIFQALAKSDTGRGLAAGIAICLLAIILDRISMALTEKQRKALGI